MKIFRQIFSKTLKTKKALFILQLFERFFNLSGFSIARRKTNDFHVQVVFFFMLFRLFIASCCCNARKYFLWELSSFMNFHSNILLIEWKYEVSHLPSIFSFNKHGLSYLMLYLLIEATWILVLMWILCGDDVKSAGRIFHESASNCVVSLFFRTNESNISFLSMQAIKSCFTEIPIMSINKKWRKFLQSDSQSFTKWCKFSTHDAHSKHFHLI